MRVIRQFRSVVFRRFIISYFAILVFPVIVVGSSFLVNTANLLQQDSHKTSLHHLEQVVNQIDYQMESISKINDQFTMNPNLTRSHLQNHLSYGAEIIHELHTVQTCYPFLKNVYLYASGSDYVYSATSTIGIERFIQQLTGETKPVDAFLSEAKQYPIHQIIGIHDGHYIYFPLRYYNSAPYGFVLFQMDLGFLRSQTAALIPPEEGTVYVENGNGELLFVSGQKVLESGTDFLQKEARLCGLKYRYDAMENDMALHINSANRKILIQLLLVLCFGSIVVFFFTHISYTPIGKLKQLLEELSEKKNSTFNELKDIEQILLQLNSTEHKALSGDPQTMRAVKQYLLMQLLENREEDGVIMQQLNVLGISLKGDCWCAAQIHFHEGTALNWTDLLDFIENVSLPECVFQSVESGKNNLALICCIEAGQKELLPEWLEDLRHALTLRYECGVTVGVGQCYEEIGKLGLSYMEASNAADYRFTKGRNKVLLYTQTVAVEENLPLDFYQSQLPLMVSAIKSSNARAVTEILKEVIEDIRTQKYSVHTARFICDDVIHTVLNTAREMQMVSDGQLKQLPGVVSLSKIDTLDEFTGVLFHLIFEICSCIPKQQDSLVERAEAYLKEYAKDTAFSVNRMASELGLSSSYLSRVFRDQTGVTISEYVNNIRIQTSKELLLCTQKPLDEIIQEIGYYDASSFIRKFKSRVGLTPGEYRKKYCRRQ